MGASRKEEDSVGAASSFFPSSSFPSKFPRMWEENGRRVSKGEGKNLDVEEGEEETNLGDGWE